jgi:hypothetical protein
VGMVNISQMGKLGRDVWVENHEDGKSVRKTLFSQEMQDDLDSDVHQDVIGAMEKELADNPKGFDMKIAPVQNKSSTGASKKEYCFVELEK